jgi:hypothetical protein
VADAAKGNPDLPAAGMEADRPAAPPAERADVQALGAGSMLKTAAAPAGPAHEGLALARRDEPVACEVLSADGRVVRRILAPVDASPPPAVSWAVEVDATGATSVRSGLVAVVPQQSLVRALRGLGPGRYLLRRQ